MALEINQFVLEDCDGKQWVFYLSERQRLLYSRKDTWGWSEPSTIDRQLIQSFCATMDPSGKVYILAYTHTKQLFYYEWNGTQWLQRLIYRVNSRFENISFFFILSTSSLMHLVYYCENSLHKTQESFVHYYLGKGDWKNGRALHFTSEDGVIPQNVYVDNNNHLHFYYTKKQNNQNDCYYSVFSPVNLQWTIPSLLFCSSGKCSHFNTWLDSNGTLHLLWKEENESGYSICYKSKRNDEGTHSTMNRMMKLYEGSDELKYLAILPTLTDTQPIGIWMVNDKICHQLLGPEANPQDLPKPEFIKDINLYTNISHFNKNNPTTLQLAGDGYPEYQWCVLPSIQTLYEKIALQKKKGEKDNSTNKKANYHQPYKNFSAKSTNEEDISQLKKSFIGISSQIEEIYTSLYQIQEFLNVKEKSFLHLENMVKKISMESEQRAASCAPTKKFITQPEQSPQKIASKDETKKTQEAKRKEIKGQVEDEPKTPKTEEIVLGNVSVLINPEEDPEENLL